MEIGSPRGEPISFYKELFMSDLHEELSGLQPVDFDAGQIFSGKSSGTLVRGYDRPSAYTPRLDPH